MSVYRAARDFEENWNRIRQLWPKWKVNNVEAEVWLTRLRGLDQDALESAIFNAYAAHAKGWEPSLASLLKEYGALRGHGAPKREQSARRDDREALAQMRHDHKLMVRGLERALDHDAGKVRAALRKACGYLLQWHGGAGFAEEPAPRDVDQMVQAVTIERPGSWPHAVVGMTWAALESES